MHKIDRSQVSEARSRNMSAIRSRDTSLETQVCHELWHRGLRIRRNVAALVGCPDIAVRRHRVVVFIDSCFWHGCEQHCHMPKNNAEFWREKLEANRRRDAVVTAHYREANWHILRVWEHDLKQDFPAAIDAIERFIRGAMLS